MSKRIYRTTVQMSDGYEWLPVLTEDREHCHIPTLRAAIDAGRPKRLQRKPRTEQRREGYQS